MAWSDTDGTGNKIIADQLYRASDAAMAASVAVGEATGEALDEACRASEEATANLMTGVFLMATRMDDRELSKTQASAPSPVDGKR